jgi:hypothetical protein
MPCADMEINSYAHSATEFSLTQENHSHDKKSDLCPPFCICNCCGAQVLTNFQTIVYNFPVDTAIIKIALPTYKSVFSSNFYGSIWQPPQIA